MNAFELWEVQSSNLMASFPTEAEALAVVAGYVKEHGASSVDTVALVAVNDSDEEDNFVVLTSGRDLARLSATFQEAQRAIARVPRIPKATIDAMLKASEDVAGIASVTRGMADVVGIGNIIWDIAPSLSTVAAAHFQDTKVLTALANAQGFAYFSGIQLGGIGALQEQLGQIDGLHMAEIAGPLSLCVASMQESLVVSNIEGLVGAVTTFASVREALDPSTKESVANAANAFFDHETRALLNMSGDEFVRKWEAGRMIEEASEEERPKVTLLATLIPLAKAA